MPRVVEQARAPRRSAPRRPAPAGRAASGASFITACVPASDESNARSGFASIRACTSGASLSARSRRKPFSSSEYSRRVSAVPRLDSRSRSSRAPASSSRSASSAITSASIAGSSEPSTSAPTCVNWRKRPGLRRLVPEERAPVPEPHRLRALVHAVLDVRAADRSGALRPQRQRPPAHVLEREHLLLHDVRGLPHAAREQLGVLEHGRLEVAVAGALERRRRQAEQRRAAPASPPAARRRCPSAPGGSAGQLRQERVGRALGAEGRDAHVAGVDGRLARAASRPARGSTRAASASRRPEGRCGRPSPGRGRRPRRRPARPGSRT